MRCPLLASPQLPIGASQPAPRPPGKPPIAGSSGGGMTAGEVPQLPFALAHPPPMPAPALVTRALTMPPTGNIALGCGCHWPTSPQVGCGAPPALAPLAVPPHESELLPYAPEAMVCASGNEGRQDACAMWLGPWKWGCGCCCCMASCAAPGPGWHDGANAGMGEANGWAGICDPHDGIKG